MDRFTLKLLNLLLLTQDHCLALLSDYESPQDKAMRLYLEKRRKIEQGRAEAEKEAKTLAFNEWFAGLDNERKKGFLPENMRGGARLEKNKFLESSARNYFESEIWPNEKEKLMAVL